MGEVKWSEVCDLRRYIRKCLESGKWASVDAFMQSKWARQLVSVYGFDKIRRYSVDAFKSGGVDVREDGK